MRRRLSVLGAIVALWAVAACSLSQLDSTDTGLVTVAPTRTLQPTYTSTLTPSPTLTSTPTPTPSHTPTPTPQPTATPSPTLSPTASNTPSPSPTPSDTPRPTPRPTRRPTNTPVPRPTNTPAPPFRGKIVRGATNCDGYQGVEGFVKHGNGSPYPGVAVGVWSDTWAGRVTTSEADGKYALNLSGQPTGQYKVAVVKLETCAMQGGLPTASNCQRLSNVVDIDITEECTGPNASQITILDFTGP